MLRSFEELYPFLCGIFLAIGIIYLFSFNWNKANRAYILFGLISLFAGLWFGFVRQVEGDGSYSTYTKIYSLSYSIITLLLPWFIGYYGPLWKPKWLWLISFLQVLASIIYRIGPEIYPTPWLYFGFPAFLVTFLYGIISARILLKQGFLRKGMLFLIANTGSLLFVSMHSISTFFGNSFGIKYPESLFLIDGFIVFFLFMMTFELLFDIKSKSTFERKLAHQMERWQQTLDEVELVIVELDTDGKIKYVNPHFETITGYNASDVLDEVGFDVNLSKKDKINMEKAHKEKIEKARPFYYQYPMITSKGEQRMIFWSNVILKDDDGKATGTLSIGTDVTDRERTLNEIEKLKLSLEEENIILKEGLPQKGINNINAEGDVINQAIQKVRQVTKFQELDQLKSHFFANVSHEFRTPLTLILNPIKSILSKNKDQKLTKELMLVERNASSLLVMVNQLLDLSKLEAGKMEASTKVSNLIKTIKFLSASFDSLATSKSITFNMLFTVDELTTNYNEDHVGKILNNVLSNAFKFTEKNGKVTLILDLLDREKEIISPESIIQDGIKFIKLTVRDTGIGISKSALPHVFDRFYQAESSSTTKYEGTGIGLALVKELVELHNGTIDVKSEPGWGTEVAILLPLSTVYDVTKASEAVPESIEFSKKHFHEISNEPTTRSKPELLDNRYMVQVVEDNVDLREHIRDILSGMYQVVESKDGEEGLAVAIEHVPDLIISDVMMPKMDGIALANELKQDVRTSHIPIVLLTARSSKDDKLLGLKAGVDEYLAKPFDADELKIRIENLIEIRRNLQQQFGNGNAENAGKGPSREEEFFAKAKGVVNNNLDNDQFSVEDLAGELNMSRVQFHRKIKALTDQSTTTFIRNIRLEKARELLQTDKYNVTEVAYMVGFSSQSYFTKSFQKHFGFPPSNV